MALRLLCLSNFILEIQVILSRSVEMKRKQEPCLWFCLKGLLNEGFSRSKA